MASMDYYKVLSIIHKLVKPRTYIEIGVRHGESWQLSGPAVKSIGIDPNPSIHLEPAGQAQLFHGTSDEFFAQHAPAQIFGQSVDLAFIDGMHLFEFALRDFYNLEKHCAKDGFILVHDCLPIDAITSARDRTTSLWSGDVWKLIVCLKEVRPDLQIDVIDTAPTGLAIISNLDPTSTVLADRYKELTDTYVSMRYEVLGDEAQKRTTLNVSDESEANIERICSRPGEVKSASVARRSGMGSNGEEIARRSDTRQTLRKPGAPRKLGVLLCYNDGDILVDVLDHMISNGHDLLVWDHGSTDETPEILRRYRGAIAEQQRISRQADFYGIYQAMSETLLKDWVGKYDWISWPDQDEVLEGAHRGSSYADQVHEAYAEGTDWIAFNNINFWWTTADATVIQSPIRRIRHYSIFPNCAPRVRSWRASKTNIRQFNHNPLEGKKHPQHFNLRHYPMRSRAQMQRRVNHDRAGLQRGAMNFHYANMARHPEKLVIAPTQLHRDDGVTELNLACRFDWKLIYGSTPAVNQAKEQFLVEQES